VSRPTYEEPPVAQRYEQQRPSSSQQARARADDLDETERRLRAEKERQERIKRQLHDKGGPPPNFNVMLTQSRRRMSASSFDDGTSPQPAQADPPSPEPSPAPPSQAISSTGFEHRSSFHRSGSSAQNDVRPGAFNNTLLHTCPVFQTPAPYLHMPDTILSF
jgi:hypothetical protein